MGWGKKETQFHGAVEKPSNPNASETISHMLSKDDDQQTRISWRGDGTYVAISVIHADGNRRKILVYNREAVLISISEEVMLLEHVLAWM
jgi:elongator complex protein 1